MKKKKMMMLCIGSFGDDDIEHVGCGCDCSDYGGDYDGGGGGLVG